MAAVKKIVKKNASNASFQLRKPIVTNEHPVTKFLRDLGNHKFTARHLHLITSLYEHRKGLPYTELLLLTGMERTAIDQFMDRLPGYIIKREATKAEKDKFSRSSKRRIQEILHLTVRGKRLAAKFFDSPPVNR